MMRRWSGIKMKGINDDEEGIRCYLVGFVRRRRKEARCPFACRPGPCRYRVTHITHHGCPIPPPIDDVTYNNRGHKISIIEEYETCNNRGERRYIIG